MARRRASSRQHTAVAPLVLDFVVPESAHWFVYVFSLADCTRFKVGFSCNPLQRICTFSRRYFERFDLSQSILCRVADCDMARWLEGELKAALSEHRTTAPEWVPAEAGGHTEWFSAVYFSDAEDRLRLHTRPELICSAFEQFATDLQRARSSFEAWAVLQARRAHQSREFASRGYAVRDQSVGLRDWLGAYRYFGIELFADEPELGRWIDSNVSWVP